MSTAESAFGGSNGGREFGPNEWANAGWRRGACGVGRWTAFEIIAMVLGFAVFWPIGLAILGYKFWQRKFGGDDLQTFATTKWNEARAAMSSMQPGARRRRGPGPADPGARGQAAPTGNRAFDDWKSAELARLEEERRKLEDAHREFAEFVENIRKAKDREEFERFMNERRNRPGTRRGFLTPRLVLGGRALAERGVCFVINLPEADQRTSGTAKSALRGLLRQARFFVENGFSGSAPAALRGERLPRLPEIRSILLILPVA